MSPELFAYVRFSSVEDWDNFTLVHGMAHQTTEEAMLRMSLTPELYPMLDFPRVDNTEYLLAHYAAHQSNAHLLNLPSIPDISQVNMADESDFNNWMQLHAIIHQAENAALGITV